jgi:hypothetical protein|tara:strand:- start:231 stop:398 length:168 start_codon:yes stop_codon:yes gene_type:complete
VHAALIRQQSILIREEIFRIDRRYGQLNLLRLIPMGVKAIKGLKEWAGEDWVAAS